MQDIHPIGVGGGGYRRSRPHHGNGSQALNCPRCDSLNTKFCYFNNYNLSQPRYYCKTCRRYWTNGGVLRNVPLGGGCRKTKRSKPKSSDAVATLRERKTPISQNSSSDGSSLTAATATEVLSVSNSTNSPTPLFNLKDSSARLFEIPQSSSLNPSFDAPTLGQSSADNNPVFSEIGTFTNLMTSSTDNLPLGFNMSADISYFRLQQQSEEEVVENGSSRQQQWMHTIGSVDQMTEMENRGSNGGHAVEDCGDEAMFEVTGTLDHQTYWSQASWNDQQLNFLH